MLMYHADVAAAIEEAATKYAIAYSLLLNQHNVAPVETPQDIANLDQLTNDAALLFRRYLTARVDYKMYTSPLDRSAYVVQEQPSGL